VGLPDVKGREEIFGVHTRKKPVHEGVNFNKLARVTPGFSGADIEALCNEAAIFAARAGRERIMQEDFDEALEKVLIGLERDGAMFSLKKRQVVAVHEAGHALTALLLEGYDEVRKVTISPRGSAGGVTQFLPHQDQLDSGLYSKDYLEKQLIVALGGRAAEIVAFGESQVTTGASADMQSVYKIARAMVTQYGFNTTIGNIAFPAHEMHYTLSQATQKTIDAEILITADDAYKNALRLIQDNRAMLEAITNALLEKETLSGQELLGVVEPFMIHGKR
jgi:cell division protease FtsH